MSAILNPTLQAERANLDELVKNLHDLTVEIDAHELANILSELRNRLQEPFMFVIVGEVKAGKSSFINALLSTGKEICKVAPQPMTDTVQQVLYGEKEATITINPYLKKIFHPVDILKEIAIVDTPGTNTIIEHHQEITERFIPASDLIVFVFEAKNPYRQSAWEFFDFIHSEWRRKVIFVLQQKDLIGTEDLEVNRKGVFDQAEKKGVHEPQVFTVSAKMELEGNTLESGFGEIRNYILENITGGKAPLLKLQSSLDTTFKITEQIKAGLETRRQQWVADKEFRADVEDILETREKISHRQVEMLVENLLAAYDRIALRSEKELESELSVFGILKRSIASIFDKKASIKAWSERFSASLERDLQSELQEKLRAHIGDLAESIQQMAKMIDMKIQASKTILRNNHEIFSDIAERRANVLKDLQEAFTSFLSKPENFTDKELFPEYRELSPNILTGSGLAVIGTILMVVTHGMVFDITGGILTTVGVLFAGITTSVKKRKIVSSFKEEMIKGREALHEEITGNLKTYVVHIRQRLNSNFEEFDRLLASEEKQLQQLGEKFNAITSGLENSRKNLSSAEI